MGPLTPFADDRDVKTGRCLVLDLDETLACTDYDIANLNRLDILNNPSLMDLRSRIYLLQLTDFRVPKGTGTINEMWGIMRPHLHEFLVFAFSYFETIVVWTAGQPDYAYAMCDGLFLNVHPPHLILTSKNCVPNGPSKPLTQLFNDPYWSTRISPNNTLMIDDRADNMAANVANGIIIPSYKPPISINGLRSDDICFLQLKKWLLQPEIQGASDVRTLDKSRIFLEKL